MVNKKTSIFLNELIESEIRIEEITKPLLQTGEDIRIKRFPPVIAENAFEIMQQRLNYGIKVKKICENSYLAEQVGFTEGYVASPESRETAINMALGRDSGKTLMTEYLNNVTK